LFAYFQVFPSELAGGISGDRLLPYYIMLALPQGVSGLLITAIFAAAMSSMDSGIHSAATVLINDVLQPLRTKVGSDRRDVKHARFLILILGSFATLAAFYASSITHILKASSMMLSLFGGPILALFLLGILSRQANFRGWLIGFVVAVPTTLWLQQGTVLHFIYYFPACFGTCAAVGYTASRLLGTVHGGPLGPPELTLWSRPSITSHLDAT